MDLVQREAVIRYDAAKFQIQEMGAFVTCAATGKRIPLEDLKYWAVDRQEPYVDALAATEANRRRDR